MSKKQNKVKNLNLADLKKEVKKLDSQTEHEILIGESAYKVKIDDVFRKTKQHKVLDDLVLFFNEANNKMDLLDIATPYVTLLFIKHFTNVDVPDDVEGSLELLDVLVDLDLLSHILNLMPDDEVIKVYELIQVTVERMKDNLEATEEDREKMMNLVENPEFKEMLLDGKFKQ